MSFYTGDAIAKGCGSCQLSGEADIGKGNVETMEQPDSSASSSEQSHAYTRHGQDRHHHHHHHHNHNDEEHEGHSHPRHHISTHTVIHGLRSKHPPHHHRHHVTRKYLVARPRARQYFSHDGDLHKEADDGLPRAAGKFELFLDLLYIGLCANFAEDCIHHPTDPNYLGKYVLIFIPAWRIWSDITSMMNMYYTDDLVQRLLIAWVMVLMLIYGNNAIYVDQSLGALRLSAGSFIIARATIAITNLFYSLSAHHHAFQLRAHNALVLMVLPLWTPVFLSGPSIVAKVCTALVALAVDQLCNFLVHNRWIYRHFNLRYTTALDIDHHVDRMTAFFIIVLGEFLYGLVWASPAAATDGHVVAKAARAAISLLIAFCLCWLYCSVDASRENPETGVHALRWRAGFGLLWVVIHLPLSAALLIAGDICAVFVEYGDMEKVTKHAKRAGAATGGASGEFPTFEDMEALKWQFCGGLAVGLVCMYVICLLHHEADEDDESKDALLIPHWLRRLPRLPTAVIIACLPLAKSLSVTDIMITIIMLLAATLFWEMLGALDRQKWSIMEKVNNKHDTLVVCPMTLEPVSTEEKEDDSSLDSTEKFKRCSLKGRCKEGKKNRRRNGENVCRSIF